MEQHIQHVCPLEECNKVFKARKSLMEHMRIHNGQKPYHCHYEGCNRRFTQYSSMQKHERTHTGAKPYKCNQCSKLFTQVSNLKRHERVHAGEKPYVCEACEKCFSTASNLKQHMVTHQNEDIRAKLRCDICRKSYLYRSSLRKHLLEHEKVTSQTDVKIECNSTEFDVKEEQSRIENEPKPSKQIFMSPNHAIKSNAMDLKVECVPKEEEEEVKQTVDKSPIKLMLVIQCNLDSLLRSSMLSQSSENGQKLMMISLESLLGNASGDLFIKDTLLQLPSGSIKYNAPNAALTKNNATIID